MKTGSARHHTGLAAEDTAARLYTAGGAAVLARRARTGAGEIDLVLEQDREIVFVEVKARASHAAAAASLSARQRARLLAAAEAWLAQTGRSLLTPCRFDVATVDATGRAERLVNALAF